MTEVGKKPEVSFTKVSSRVNSKFLSKTITFHCPVEYTDSYQIPIYISGYVETKSGKRIGQASFEFSPGFRFNEQINGFAYEAKRVSTEVLLHLVEAPVKLTTRSRSKLTTYFSGEDFISSGIAGLLNKYMV